MDSPELEGLVAALEYLRDQLRDPTLGTGLLLPLLSTALNEGTSQSALAARLAVHEVAVSKQVERLVDLGLAERRVRPGERHYAVWLTEHGAQVARTVSEIVAGKR